MSDTATMARGRLREQTAEEIRALLARRRISAAELARRTGMKQSTLARRMTGETAFDLDDLEAISDALDVPLNALLPPTFRSNERSAALPVRPTTKRREPSTRPKGRGPSEPSRPVSAVPANKRRPRPFSSAV